MKIMRAFKCWTNYKSYELYLSFDTFIVHNLELNMKNMNSNTIKVLVLNWIVSKQTELSINGVTVES